MAFRTFGTWLKQFATEDTALGDLASDMLWSCVNLKQNPSYFKTPQMLLSRMETQGASDAAKAVLREAAEMYGQPIETEEHEEDYDY